MASEKGTPTERFTPEQVAEALIESFGVMAVAARRLGVTRMTIWRYIRRYETCRKAREEGRERLKDLAESKLVEAIADREPWAIQFYLRTQGRDRGYGDEVKVLGDPSQPLVFKVVTHWPETPLTHEDGQ